MAFVGVGIVKWVYPFAYAITGMFCTCIPQECISPDLTYSPDHLQERPHLQHTRTERRQEV